MDLSSILEEPLDWRHRWAPPGPPATIGSVAERAWNLLQGDLLLPAMVLKDASLEHNLALMQAFCQARNLSLAPHAKTTMAPQLIARQLERGAWGMTVASVAQARVCRHFGVGRILIANQLADRNSLAWAAGELQRNPALELLSLVDSEPGVHLMDKVLEEFGPGQRLPVLVELGHLGGRTGARSATGALVVARAVKASAHLELAGVETFEGLLKGEQPGSTLALVDTLCQELRSLAVAADREGLFQGRQEVVVSGGGSAYLDRVATELADLQLSRPVRTLLRSGCYITHDHLHYRDLSPFGTRIPGERLVPALEAWAPILARPEPGLAIAGFGKRDVPYDLGLPIPLWLARAGRLAPASGIEITQLNDQHAHLLIPADADLRVGDLVGCGISHPCTAFDKWRSLPLVDEGYRVIGAIATFF